MSNTNDDRARSSTARAPSEALRRQVQRVLRIRVVSPREGGNGAPAQNREFVEPCNLASVARAVRTEFGLDTLALANDDELLARGHELPELRGLAKIAETICDEFGRTRAAPSESESIGRIEHMLLEAIAPKRVSTLG